MAENAQARLLRYLNDAYAAEMGGLKSLQALAGEAQNADLKSAVSTHIIETQSQADRLKARIGELGGTVSEPKAVVDSVISLGSHILNIFHDAEDKETQDTIKALSLEAFEIGAYTSMQAYASAIGDSTTASLASTIIGEEKSAHDKLLAVIPELAKNAAAKVGA